MNTEHIDIGLARYSDWAFTASVMVLVLALLMLAVELASSRGRRVEERELVSAGGVPTVAAGEEGPGLVVSASATPLAERIGKAGLALVYLGIGLLLACIVLRGMATLGAVGQHVRVHQPDQFLRAGGGRRGAA